MSEELKPCPLDEARKTLWYCAQLTDGSNWENQYRKALKTICNELDRRAQQPNEPLTVDELREMDKSPVFSQHCGWGIVGFRKVGTGEQEHSKRCTVGFSYGWEWLDDVMRTGPLYRRPPESGETE